MSMFDDDSYNEGLNAGKRIAIGSIIASVAVLGILIMTVMLNGDKLHKNNGNNNNNPYPAVSEASEESTEEEEEDREKYRISGNKRTSDELDFWNMYDEEEEESIVVSENSVSRNSLSRNSLSKNKASKVSANMSKKKDSLSKNGFNISVSGQKAVYVSINSAVEKSELNPAGFTMEGDRLVYSDGGRNISHFGIDVSKYNGSISWNAVKQDGVEYALLRVGARGYSTGGVILDENFAANLQGCSENGIDVGVYFFSQAININEAVEEANYCVASLGGAKIRYPVIFDSEKISNDTYRTEALTPMEQTDIFIAFADTVKAYGYIPMLAGSKEQLAKHFDLTRLNGYDIWLLDAGEKTDYPYRYCIRQYSDTGQIKGINGNVNYDICLISYADK